MTDHDGMGPAGDLAAIADEYTALADLLESSGLDVWEAPSLCEGWRTREVVAHMTMPARYPGPAFMAELEAAGGDFTRLSNTVAARDGALPVPALVADLRSEVLHGWQPPGGGMDGALDALRDPRARHRGGGPAGAAGALGAHHPGARARRRRGRAPNMFGVDLDGVELRADDLVWSAGSGAPVTGPAQALALVACGRLLPAGRLGGAAAGRFSQS